MRLRRMHVFTEQHHRLWLRTRKHGKLARMLPGQAHRLWLRARKHTGLVALRRGA